jgi:hypothetical protein
MNWGLMPKLCELCQERPASIPDRNREGRPINRICSQCHRIRLAGDLRNVLVVEYKKRHPDKED